MAANDAEQLDFKQLVHKVNGLEKDVEDLQELEEVGSCEDAIAKIKDHDLPELHKKMDQVCAKLEQVEATNRVHCEILLCLKETIDRQQEGDHLLKKRMHNAVDKLESLRQGENKRMVSEAMAARKASRTGPPSVPKTEEELLGAV